MHPPRESHRQSFTLVELLVVIAIISLLAAMLAPALKNARESARSAACVNNLHQIGLAQIMYAQNHDDWTPCVYDSGTSRTWIESLCAAGYLPSPQVGAPTFFLCPSQSPRVWDASRGMAYGMILVSTVANSDNRYQITGSSVMAGTGVDYGPPAGWRYIADSIYNNAASPSIYRKQRYYFLPDVAGNDMAHLRHRGRGNFLFCDGHVSSQTKADLVGQNVSVIPAGLYSAFIDGAIDVSGPNY